MEQGLVHIYCGDGKGKTTCAVGLMIRCAGQGGRVLCFQFLKGDNSGERRILEKLEGEEKRLIVFRYFQDMTQTELSLIHI